MKREVLFAAIEDSWNAETSASKEWSTENKALGQCAVTACVIQNYLGGHIFNTIATLPDGSTDSHYYNWIDGEDVDITRSQFPEGTTYSEGEHKTKGYVSGRAYVLSYLPTMQRYELLKNRVEEKLAQFTGE